jgi:hypothetical protein
MIKVEYKLSNDFKSCLRHFAYYYTNGTLQYVIGDDSILAGVDYREMLKDEASLVETAFAIYSNNIKFDEKGIVINHSHCMMRAAQWIKLVCVGESNYQVDPEFEDWETYLH